MENKYAEGSTVYARANTEHALVVRRFVKRIYYCTDQSIPQQKDQVYFERELQDYKGATAPLPAQ
jgi:hypothetical protein